MSTPISVSQSFEAKILSMFIFLWVFSEKKHNFMVKTRYSKKVSFDMKHCWLFDVHIQQFERTLQCVDNLQMQIGLFIEIYLYAIPLLLKYQVRRIIYLVKRINTAQLLHLNGKYYKCQAIQIHNAIYLNLVLSFDLHSALAPIITRNGD